MRAQDPDTTATEATPADPLEEDLSRIRERAETIREDAVEQACARLRAHGDLAPDDREAIERLADRLVGRLLVVPARGLAAAEEDEEVVETVRELFAE